jgi:hypothetical protein
MNELCPRCGGYKDRPIPEGNCDPNSTVFDWTPFPRVHQFHASLDVLTEHEREEILARY